MLDIGWSEFLVIGVVALIVIGPRELPVALRTAGRYVARARALAREFRDGLDDIARETEIKNIGNKIAGDFDGDEWLDADAAKRGAKLEAKDGDAERAEADRAEAELDAADFDSAEAIAADGPKGADAAADPPAPAPAKEPNT